MKKMTLSKAKFYAKQILNYENELSNTQDKAKISEIQGVNEELSNKINQVGVDYEFACESSGEENTLILVKKQNNSI